LPRFLAIVAAAAALTCGSAVRAQAPDDTTTTNARDWNYPPQGPTRSQARAAGADEHWWENGPWSVAASFGPAWFAGDGISSTTDFAAEARLARDLSHDVYLLGSYTFLLAETKVTDPATGSSDEEDHDLHAISFGAGFRLDVTDEVQLFIEPKAGVLFGGDTDPAPVGMLSAGLEVLAAEGVRVRVAVTGLVTDADISTKGRDANLDSGVFGSVGIVFEF
jgi:hypothetical protein